MTVLVQLLGVDTDLYRLLSEHHDEVSRELKLVDSPAEGGRSSGRSFEVAGLLRAPFLALVRPLRAEVARARVAGERFADIKLDVDREGVRLFRALHEALCEIDDAARAGDLLALPLSDAPVALRLWIVEEVERQVLRGLAPRPWATVAS